MFDYVFVLVSIIIGLAVTHLLQGVVTMTQTARGKPLYWVHLLWVANLLFNLVFWWWFEFGLRLVAQWTFQLYAFVLIYAVLMYVICALLIPRDVGAYADWRDWFISRRAWFFTALTLVGPVDLADTLLKGQRHVSDLGWGYFLPSIVLTGTTFLAIFIGDRRYQAAVAVIYMAMMLWLAFGLFGTLA